MLTVPPYQDHGIPVKTTAQAINSGVHWLILVKPLHDVRAVFKPAIERVQALADVSHSALYTFAVHKAVSLCMCVLS